MSDGQRNTKPVDDNYQADLDDVGFWLRVALLQPPQMSYGGVSVKTIPTEQIKAMLRTLDQQATLEAERDVAYAELSRVRYAIDRLTVERDAARAEVERLRAACAGISEGLIRTATHGVENLTKRDWLIQTAQNITAALETEVDHD